LASFKQTGSAFILMASFFGAIPSIVTTPFTSPAVAASTFIPAGAAADEAGKADLLEGSLPPPHATTDAARVIPSPYTQTFRKRIDLFS
jgi:hypothetical protein